MKYAIALALVLSAPAFAGTTLTTCQLPELSGSVEVTFDPTPSQQSPYGVATSKLVVGDTEIPMVRSACWYKNVPGQRGYLCAHQDDTTRYDVQPRFGKNEDGSNNGIVNRVLATKYAADGKATYITSEDCR